MFFLIMYMPNSLYSSISWELLRFYYFRKYSVNFINIKLLPCFQVWVLRSFSIQLKFPRGQKIPPDFRNEHAQSWHLRKRTKKKKVKNFQLSWRILEKKSYQPIKFK